MIFDTHAHYYDEAFDADRDALLASLPGRGVALVVCPGCDPESSRQSIALAERYGFLYAAAGYHPENLEGAALSDLDAVRALCAHPKVVAVGEIGLDYYWKENPPRDLQQRVFRHQMELAGELGLPVIVHDRDAHRDCLDIVRAHPGVRGVFHCYSGSLEDAKVLVDKGCMLSFTGNITFKNARKLVIKCVKLVVFYVYAVHKDFALCCVIKSWYKAYKRCLAASCCTDYGKCLTLVYLETYVAQLVLRGMRISERNVFKFHSALLSSLADASLFYVHVTLKHFVDTLC